MLQHESGERRFVNTREVREAVLPAIPFPYSAGASQGLREGVEAGPVIPHPEAGGQQPWHIGTAAASAHPSRLIAAMENPITIIRN